MPKQQPEEVMTLKRTLAARTQEGSLPDNTSVFTLIRAAEIGYSAGLHYVYAGNRPGYVGRYENTYCPGCGELLIERWGFRVLKHRLKAGSCPKCKTTIAGVWDKKGLEMLRASKYPA